MGILWSAIKYCCCSECYRACCVCCAQCHRDCAKCCEDCQCWEECCTDCAVNCDNCVAWYEDETSKVPCEENKGVKGRTWVLNRVHPIRNLEDKVCVVSFHPETNQHHTVLTRSVLPESKPIVSVLINEHADILELPPYRTFIMYVDFNQRNTILEDESIMGDIKVTTAEAIIKKGGDLILVYMGNQASEQLGQGELYNPNFTVAQTHPVLSRIASKMRFFTIYKDFTPYQKHFMNQVIP